VASYRRKGEWVDHPKEGKGSGPQAPNRGNHKECWRFREKSPVGNRRKKNWVFGEEHEKLKLGVTQRGGGTGDVQGKQKRCAHESKKRGGDR